MEKLPDTIVESRKELMISPIGQENPTYRTAHFLKPSVQSIDECNFKLSSLSLPLLPPTIEPKNWPLTVNFHGWRNPPEGWQSWVGKMSSLHESTWKKVGIHEAILNSTYRIEKNSDLVLGVAERWCRDTKSFIFPWGEATVTLEDMMIAGYSVLGFSVFHPLKTAELKGIEEELVQARLEIVRSAAKKASHNFWMKKFMGSSSKIEHEAFLSLWLSRFVLPTSYDVICEGVFPIAIHLARGTRIALAPAVLASIYSDLSLLKENIIYLTTSADKGDDQSKLTVTIRSPLQLVLAWVWERFVKLRPKPNLIKNGEPRLALWNNLKCKLFYNVRLVLDSSEKSFSWRPYTRPIENWNVPKLYREKEMWVSVDSDLDEDLLSFIRCLMVSELVGINCIQQYLPHRVARQFGIDQDVPGFVARCSESPEVAWSSYSRQISGVKCYIPPRLFKTEVTTRYLEWWNHSAFDPQVANKGVLQQQKGSTSTCLREAPKGSREGSKGQKFVSSFKIRPKSLKEKEANALKSLRVPRNRCKRPKKGKTISSFSIAPNAKSPKESKGKSAEGKELSQTPISSSKITPEAQSAQGKKLRQTLISSFTITSKPKSAEGKELRETLISSLKITPKAKGAEGNGKAADCIRLGFLPNNSKIVPQILKRKRNDNSSIALGNPAKQSKTLAGNSSIKNEENGESSFSKFPTMAEINNLPVPPGFPSKHNSVEVRDSTEEDDWTIAEMLKCGTEHDVPENGECGNVKNVSDKPQNHPSPIANDEACQASSLATSMKRILQTEAVQNEQDGGRKNAPGQFWSPSSTSDNRTKKVVDLVTSVEKAKHCKAGEDRQDDGDEAEVNNASSELGRHSCHSAGDETPKNLEPQAIAAEKGVLSEAETGVQQEVERADGISVGSLTLKVEIVNGNEEGSSGYSSEAPELNFEAQFGKLEKIRGVPEINLEARVSRLEKIIAERKAAMFGHVSAGPSL